MSNKGHTYTRICVVCGEPFQATSTTGRYCFKPECQEQHTLDLRRKKRESEARRRAAGLLIKAPKEEKRKAEAVVAFKKSDKSIREIVKKAAELGLSYGQYVGRYEK